MVSGNLALRTVRDLDRGRIAYELDRALIYGSIILIPFDIVIFHEACLPLAALAGLLMIVRRDFSAFLSFMRGLPVFPLLAIVVCAFAVLSLYGNLNAILASTFQEESGWSRGVAQAVLLMLSLAFSFYLAFCLRQHADWQAMIIRAAWWSLPIPLMVGAAQLANVFGVPGLSHLPYVGGASEGGFWRLTSVARESSWFGSFVCVILPFLIIDLAHRRHDWRRWAGIGAVAVTLLFVAFGLSKSAFAGMAMEIGVGGLWLLRFHRPWRAAMYLLFGILFLCTALFALSILMPQVYAGLVAPFVNKAVGLYELFKPLLLDNTKFISIGTRFGMSTAGVAMGNDHPIFGVGLGQFGFHAYNYMPIWGFNRETLGWLANDAKSWPSTSNLYTRLFAEIGGPGAAAYVLFRFALLIGMGVRLLRKGNAAWQRDLAIFSVMCALIAFDFHRDSFISQDMWTTLGMAFACLSGLPSSHGQEKDQVRNFRVHLSPAYLGLSVALFFGVAMIVAFSTPVSYRASATLVAKTTDATVGAASGGDDTSPDVEMNEAAASGRFGLFQTFWASRAAAARILASRPDLVRAILGTNRKITSSDLANYIKYNISVLEANKQTTLTLQYRNSNPALAEQFLAESIKQTDHAVAATSTAMAQQGHQLLNLALQQNVDDAMRQEIIDHAAARELQGDFDNAGENASFDYVEQPSVAASRPLPAPPLAILFALLIACIATAVAAAARLLFGQADSIMDLLRARLRDALHV